MMTALPGYKQDGEAAASLNIASGLASCGATSGANGGANDGFSRAATALVSRNITVLGRRTSIRLESQMWAALKEIADRELCSIHDLCSLVATRRKSGLSLTASIRIFLMLYFKAASTEDGHARAGHGGLNRMVSRLLPGNVKRSNMETSAMGRQGQM